MIAFIHYKFVERLRDLFLVRIAVLIALRKNVNCKSPVLSRLWKKGEIIKQFYRSIVAVRVANSDDRSKKLFRNHRMF